MMTDESPASTAIKQNQAFILALTAFSGFFIPFCNVIIPLVLYLKWRGANPYVASSGIKVVWAQALFTIGLGLTLTGIIVGVVFTGVLHSEIGDATPAMVMIILFGGLFVYLLLFLACMGVAIYQAARAYAAKF